MTAAPCMIGIAGGSCSGKTTLAQAVAARLGAATVLPVDAYYRDLSGLSTAERVRCNFDAPDAVEHELLAAHLGALARGAAVERPVYDFVRHVRAAHGEAVAPTRFMVIEGLFALYWPEVRARLRTRVFVDAADALCLARRRARDCAERGRTAASVEAQYAATVRPMFEAYVLPTRRHADVVVPGDSPLADAVAQVLEHVMARCRTD